MTTTSTPHSIAIIGAGPAGIFLYKQLIRSGKAPATILLFEKEQRAGMGMPYSFRGASREHVSNVSGNEIPELVSSVEEWLKHAPAALLSEYNITAASYNEFKVLPRLLFGQYLAAQFDALRKEADEAGISTQLLLNTCVTDVRDKGESIVIETANNGSYIADKIVIATGHRWPKQYEGKIKGWFDSPYPPAKLMTICNQPVAIKGASLTAIDAMRTLARANGHFLEKADGMLQYELNEDCPNFRMVMHSLEGLLPAIRFHLEDSHLSQGTPFSTEEISSIMEANNGFIPLDLVYERNFKAPLREKNSAFYESIQHMTMEEFVEFIMQQREQEDAFSLFKKEYKEAALSFKKRESIYWKEILAVLSYEMNYPAKHFSAEDMLRLKKTLMPLVAIIIAFVPQSSCKELIALQEAGILRLQAVDKKSDVKPSIGGGAVYSYKDQRGIKVSQYYPAFISAIGQPHFMIKDFIFPALVNDGTVSEAQVRFNDAAKAKQAIAAGNKEVLQNSENNYWLKLPGININDKFQVLDKYGVFNPRVYIMAVPYIAGLNPDYSGLDFCERASGIIAADIVKAASYTVIKNTG